MPSSNKPIPNAQIHYHRYPRGSVKRRLSTSMGFGRGFEHGKFSEHLGVLDKPHNNGPILPKKGVTSSSLDLNTSALKANKIAKELEQDDSPKKSRRYFKKKGML